MQGSESDLFDVIAHPDRIFRHKTDWSGEMSALSKGLIETVCSHHLKLEKIWNPCAAGKTTVKNTVHWFQILLI